MKKSFFSLIGRSAALLLLCLSISAKSEAQIITTVAGTGTSGYSGDGGPATAATISHAYGMTRDSSNNIYFADHYNHVIRKIDPSGIITTFAGNHTGGFSGDGGPATAARLSVPNSVTADRHGNIYIADEGNHCIRKVTPAGIISTIAGTPHYPGYSGDGGPATSAEIESTTNVAVDTAGNIYIPDFFRKVIRKVDVSGIITTFAGVDGHVNCDSTGAATVVAIPGSYYVEVGVNQSIYTGADQTIGVINPAGIYSPSIGRCDTAGYNGDNRPASTAALYHPRAMCFDEKGNMFFSDMDNFRIRKVSTSGIITTVAGNGTSGFSGDGGAATAAMISPSGGGVVIDTAGNLYFSDQGNQRIRKISCVTTRFAGFLSGTSSVCIGSTTTFNSTKTGGTWITANAAVASVNAATGLVTGAGVGSTNIIYVVTGTCGSDTASHTVTVTSTPNAGTISGTATVCAGTTTALTSTATGGTWSSSSSTIATVHPLTGLVTAISAGTVTIFYIVSSSCGSDTASYAITVDPMPDAGTIFNSVTPMHLDTFCYNVSLGDTTGIPGGTWALTNTAVASISTTGFVSTTTYGVRDTAMYIVSNPCGRDTAWFGFVLVWCPDAVGNLHSAVSRLQFNPNPNNGSFMLNITSSFNEEAPITITNILGQKVKEMTVITNKETNVQLNVAKGIYFISAVLKGERITGKIVVE